MNNSNTTLENLIDSISDSSLIKIALTHSSYSKDHPSSSDNERLEFFGDAVLKLVFSKYLYYRFPDNDEGKLTKYRSRLISDDLLSMVASALNLENLILRGSTLKNKKLPKSVLGDGLEALIGAFYIDQGYEFTESFIMEAWSSFIDQAILDSLSTDYKSILQEKLQEHYKAAPTYEIISTTGPDHSKSFVVGVYLADKLLAQGTGHSKKQASQKAARLALESTDL